MSKKTKRCFIITSKDIEDYKRKMYARRLVTKALKSNRIQKSEVCEICKCKSQLSAHHVDYGRPLAVFWLCNICHGQAHRKHHPLNPKNNIQTPNCLLWEKKECISISISVPIEQFIAIKKQAEISGMAISKIIRKKIIKEFPISTDQLKFKFEEKKQDESKYFRDERIPSMGENETKMSESKSCRIQEFWKERNNDMSQMVAIPEFPRRYGESSRRI
jgi:hypothetical protein